MHLLDGGKEGMLTPLPLPMPGLGIQLSVTADELAAAASDALDTQMAWGIDGGRSEHRTEFSIAALGSLLITSGRTTPVALSYSQGERVTVEMCYAGTSRFREGITDLRSTGGEVLVFPNAGGILCGGLHSGISFSLEKQRLVRTAQAMWNCDISMELETPHVLGGVERRGRSSPLFELFRYIDRVLLEEPYLADGLALDDQAYRLVAIEIAQKAYPAQLARRQTGKRRWSSSLDELVDYIASNRCSAITLTELEEQGNYSRRHLQNLFRERFGCTPMQFVRRQRLTAAMELLQAAEEGTTVSRVARDCGYRSISNFSSDFQRVFGVQPSQVLRRSTRQQTRSRSSLSTG